MSREDPETGFTPPEGFLALVAEGGLTGNRAVRRVLASLGVRRVFEAQDGAEALGAFAERKPGLLVLDWRQDLVSATEIIACARDPGRSHAADLPVVVTMADPTRTDVEAALSLKVDAIVAKPYSASALRARLLAALHRPAPS